MKIEKTRVTCEIAGRPLVIETGHVARQAHGSCIVTYGDTQCFAAVTHGAAREDIDFFPLTVDYREKTDSAGKIPGGFFKREGRPTTKEILTMRMTDRSIRPLFPDGFRREVQVMSRVFGYDGKSPADILAMIASFAALHISEIPFGGALGAIRVGKLDGRLSLMPTDLERRADSGLDLVLAGSEEAIVMVEADAKELPEAEMLDALELGHEAVRRICKAVDDLRAKVGRPKLEFVPPVRDEELERSLEPLADEVRSALFTEGKLERSAAVKAIRDRVVEERTASIEDEKERLRRAKAVKNAFGELESRIERGAILEGKRVDGRSHDDIRPITIVPEFVPRQHGSALFTRGETQALVSCTLGTPDDEQIIDGIEEEYRKSFYLHYSFPPFCVGETRRIMGPGRREIGHGMLAERALSAVLPPQEQFPYTIRVVSEILESNGSSSMATVCGGTLSMMLAGVPLLQPVAGVAMGLIQEGDRVAILSDITGSEDHTGDMDFKVAGSGLGITALQMDIKVTGVSRELLERALHQARVGRIEVLKKMLEVVGAPKSEISKYAPRMEVIRIPSDRIAFLIGPGGRTIRGLQDQFKVKIAVVSDEGQVSVAGIDRENVEKALQTIRAMCETPKIGARYTATVKSTKDFGAFLEILPGVEGMCHISELAEGYVDRVEDVVKVGDELEVVVINVDDRGKIKLSHRQALAKS